MGDNSQKKWPKLDVLGDQTPENLQLKTEIFTISQTVYGTWFRSVDKWIFTEKMRENSQETVPDLMCPGGISDTRELAIKN
jgi:hypothetical protein